MKTFFKSLLILAAVFAFAACEDVPAPYPTPGNSGEQGGATTEEVAEGDGTLANPYNAKGANEYIATLAADAESESNIYVKGIICSIKENSTTQYGNASFYISDDGKSSSTQFYVYRCYGPDNKKFTKDDALNVGDAVIICGKVVNYKGNTPETVQNKAYIYSLNSEGGGVTPPADESTRENPYTVAQAIATQGDNVAWVKAYIVGSVPGKSYAEAVFGTENAQTTNIIIADSPAETDASKCMPVQLPSGDVRTLLNLVDNAANLGQEVLLYGTLTTYFSQPGVKTVTYAEVNGKKAGKDPNATVTPGEAKGDGTLANPYNPTAVNAYINTLAADVATDKDVYVKGKICSIKEAPTAQYGNATFYISEDGTEAMETFYAFRVYYLGNKKFTGDEALNVGDEVIICGKVVNYMGNTPETASNQAYIYSLNGKTEGGNDTPDTPNEAKGEGTQANPYNVAAAIAKCVEAGETATSEEFYVEGIVSQISSQYANTFWISDNGQKANELQFYNGLGINGTTLQNGDVKVGDKVVVKGNLVNYKGNTPELAKGCTVISVNGSTDAPNHGNDEPNTPGDVTGDVNITFSSLGLANGSAIGTQTVGDITISTDGGGNSNAPKYYDAGTNARMYPKNSMTITAKQDIESITLKCDTYQGTVCVAEGHVSASSGTVTVNGDQIGIAGIGSNTVTFTNTHPSSGTVSQIRIISIVINYAK